MPPAQEEEAENGSTGSVWKKLGWFAFLWGCGVLAVTATGWVIKLALGQ